MVRDNKLGGSEKMIGLLSSLGWVKVGLGIALIIVAGLWYVRGLKIDNLKARLEVCHMQRQALETSAEDMKKAIAAQNAAIAARIAAQKRQAEKQAAVSKEAEDAYRASLERIRQLESQKPVNATKEELCEAGRLHLVR